DAEPALFLLLHRVTTLPSFARALFEVGRARLMTAPKPALRTTRNCPSVGWPAVPSLSPTARKLLISDNILGEVFTCSTSFPIASQHNRAPSATRRPPTPPRSLRQESPPNRPSLSNPGSGSHSCRWAGSKRR